MILVEPHEIKCPKCKGINLDLCTKYVQVGRAEIRNGKWDGTEPWDAGDMGGSIGMFAECKSCGHEWVPRKIKHISRLAMTPAEQEGKGDE